MITKKGVALLIKWEGSIKICYRDSRGKLTIGVGHLLTRSELASGKIIIAYEKVRYADGLTEIQIQCLLTQDLKRFVRAVGHRVHVELTDYQRDALISFCFNVGRSAFKNSTLLRKLNQGEYGEVPGQLRRWVYSGGIKSNGLINRRDNEIKLWTNGYA